MSFNKRVTGGPIQEIATRLVNLETLWMLSCRAVPKANVKKVPKTLPKLKRFYAYSAENELKKFLDEDKPTTSTTQQTTEVQVQ